MDENNGFKLCSQPGEMKVLYMGDCTPYAKILAEKQEIMKQKKTADSQTGKIEIAPAAWKLWIKETGTEKYVLQEREETEISAANMLIFVESCDMKQLYFYQRLKVAS